MSKVFDRVLSIRAGRLPGMILVLGAEETDAGMFTAVYDLIGRSYPPAELRKLQTFTISVGKRDTRAQFYVNDVKNVEDMLCSLVL